MTVPSCGSTSMPVGVRAIRVPSGRASKMRPSVATHVLPPMMAMVVNCCPAAACVMLVRPTLPSLSKPMQTSSCPPANQMLPEASRITRWAGECMGAKMRSVLPARRQLVFCARSMTSMPPSEATHMRPWVSVHIRWTKLLLRPGVVLMS